jgi:hypothetical protein
MHCQYLAGVTGMLPLDPVLESRHVGHKIRWAAAIHFIDTLATGFGAGYALRLQGIPTLLDFLLELLFAEHISSVSLCHLSSMPQLSGQAMEIFGKLIIRHQ